MILYVIVIGIVVSLIGTGGGYWKGRSDGESLYEAKFITAQKEANDKALQLKQEAENHVADMQTAFEAGEANAKTITRTIYAKGQADVSKYPVFADPKCVLPDDSLRVLQSARNRQLAAADTSGITTSLPNPSAISGRQDGNAVPANAGGREPGVGVHQSSSPVSSGGEVQGTGHQKPKPIR